MFEKYLATRKDFEAIEEGIKTVWHPKISFVFKNKDLIKNTIFLTFDAKHLYFWTQIKVPKLKTFPCHFKKYYAYKIAHKIKISEEMQLGWQANASYFYQCLPKALLDKPCISGSLLTPFTRLHQKYLKDKKSKYWAKAYSTYESYLATIIHEVGHTYYNSYPISLVNKMANIRYLQTAIALYEGRGTKKLPRIKIYPSFAFEFYSELFAFCAEYSAAALFWTNYQKIIDQYVAKSPLKWYLEHPSFLGSRDPHALANSIGRIIISQYPSSWPQIILQGKI